MSVYNEQLLVSKSVKWMVRFMNISLTPELEKLILVKVRSGMYNNASEVVREALRLLKGHDDEKQQKLLALRQDLENGLASLDGGSGIPGDEAFTEVIDTLKRRESKK
jgi:antitoxin ParD1/3/4